MFFMAHVFGSLPFGRWTFPPLVCLYEAPFTFLPLLQSSANGSLFQVVQLMRRLCELTM